MYSLSGTVIFRQPVSFFRWQPVFTSAAFSFFAPNKKNTCSREQKEWRHAKPDKDLNKRHVAGRKGGEETGVD